MRQQIDQTIYFVEETFRDGGRAFAQIDRDRNSRKSVIEDIAREQYRDVVTVLAVNPVDGLCVDVTAEILGEARFMRERADLDDALDHDRQAAAWDHLRDLRKHEVA